MAAPSRPRYRGWMRTLLVGRSTRWRPARLAVVVVGLLLAAGCRLGDGSSVPGAAVWTDGVFDDWDGVAASLVDPTGDAAPGSPVDFGAVAVRDDPRFLHFLIDLGDTVTAQGMPGSVELVLDADGDAGTGGTHGGVDGADLSVILSRQREPAAGARVGGGGGAGVGAHGAGVGIRRIGPDGPGEMEAAGVVGLLVAPTHSSDRFELRVERGGSVAMGGVVAGRLRYLWRGEVADETAIFRHALGTEPGGEPPLRGAEEVARAPGTHRVVVWNASSRSFHRNRDAFQRVLRGLAPDVVLLDEVHADVTMEELVRFGEGLVAGVGGELDGEVLEARDVGGGAGGWRGVGAAKRAMRRKRGAGGWRGVGAASAPWSARGAWTREGCGVWPASTTRRGRSNGGRARWGRGRGWGGWRLRPRWRGRRRRGGCRRRERG